MNTANSSMVAGDYMFFQPATYSITTSVALVNGCYYIGQPGVIISAGAAVDLFTMITGTNNNIYISGFTFDETNFQSPNAAVRLVGNTGPVGSGLNKVTIANCTFQNILGTTASVFVYQSDNVRIDNNTFQNVYQAAAIHNNDALSHQNISFSGNTVRGSQRMGVELQAGGSPLSPYNNLTINNNLFCDIPNNEAISIGFNVNNATGCQIAGNRFFGCISSIELALSNAVLYGNTFYNCPGCFLISTAENTLMFGNVMKGCVNSNIYAVDGGYPGTIASVQNVYIGANMVDGTIVNGNVGGTYGAVSTTSTAGFDGQSFALPDYVSVQNFTQLDALFQDAGPAGRIVPLNMRQLFMSVADQAYFNSSTFP